MKRPKLLGVHIKCADIDKSLEFYLNYDLKPIFAYGSKEWQQKFQNIDTVDEKYNGVSLGIGDSNEAIIADGHIAVKPEVFMKRVKSSKISLFLDVESVMEVEEIARRNSYKIIEEITSYPWGMDEIVVRDPDGVVVVFRSES